MKNSIAYHIPVMLQPCLDGLQIRPDGVYVDVTFGGGGHSRAIWEQLSDKGRLVALDQDPDAQQNTWSAPNFSFVASNFAHLKNQLRFLGIKQVDGILADLGVSSHQFDAPQRGFSIREDAPLDMRMNPLAGISAKDFLATANEELLAQVFKNYGEVNNAWKLALEIVRQRANQPVETTGQLMEILRPFAPKFKEHKYFAQVFQALRIEVNQEMETLKAFLEQAADVLKPEGRLVVMSYHSLEDRLVKNFMKRGSFSGDITKDFFGNILKPLEEVVRHPIVPTEEELAINNRSRSARLRIASKTANV